MANPTTPHNLVVDSDVSFQNDLSTFLRAGNADVASVGNDADALALLKHTPFDLLITNSTIADNNGQSLIQAALLIYPGIVSIVLATNGTVEDAVRAMQHGAHDYLRKPFPFIDVQSAIDRAFCRIRLKQGSETVGKREGAPNAGRNYIIGKSNAMESVFDLVDNVAVSNSTVLITGETGTGKELIAQALHSTSLRRDQKIVSINCGAIPENLLESELFGHVKGAFTGAHQARIGRFEQAHKGTIFLDEIGNMSLSLQVKLLRVLQEREFERVGGFEKIKVDVRVIAATSSNLKEMVARHEFRSDLYYRLNVIPMHMPALRERREDVPLLTAHFIAKYCKNASIDKKVMAQEAMKMLMNYNWPGNVRELENAIERGVAMIGARDTFVVGDLPLEVQKKGTNAFISEIYIPDEGINFNTEVTELERRLIVESMRKAGGNRREAAELLHLKRTTLIEKLRRFSIEELETTDA